MTTTWRNRLLLAAPFLGVAILALVAPSDDNPTMCPFAMCTGMACPGCGMTRAASTLIRGDLSGALRYHPLVLIIVAQLMGGWVWYLMRRSGRVQPMSNRTLNVILISTGVALLAVWVVRLLNGTLPPV